MALRINPVLADRARSMRREPTAAEQLLWQSLRASRLQGLKFRRQSALHGRIVDFYCPAARLVIEIDGDTHDRDDDRRRDERFLSLGLRTFRVTNNDVMRNLSGVLEGIVRAARPGGGVTHPPAPSLEREGESC